MANIENIFRFISLRPTKLEKEKGRLNMYVYKADSKSPFYNEVKIAVTTGVAKENLFDIAVKFKSTANYVKDYHAIKFPVPKMLNWVTDNGRLSFKKGDFIASLEKIAGKALKDILKDKDFISAYNNLSDSILADILSATRVNDKEEKISAIKVLYILKTVGEKSLKLIDDELIDEFFGRSTVVFPLLKATTDKKDQPEQPKPDTSAEEREKEKNRKKEYLTNLETAHRELSKMATDEKYRYLPEVNESENARIKELENHVNLLANDCKKKKKSKNISIASSVSAMIHPAKRESVLSNKAVGLLNDNSKKILADFHFEMGKINPVNAVNRIEDEIRYIHANTESDFTYNKMIAIGGTYVDKKKFTESFIDKSTSVKNSIGSFLKKCTIKAGLGDLLIVRQTLKAYELAEFAHVENALAGEFRERMHKRLDVTEVISDTITETVTEKERDLQSAERSEMQTEAEKIIEQKAHVDAGLQVSGSYGPSVSFSASLNAGFSSSVQETQKKSTSYSREVTEKTSEKVRTKVTEELRRRVLQQIKETNIHRIDNTGQGANHMRGIYRWLNKIYDAQIYNYGQRMMYEFVIPEPASFFLYATVENPPTDSDLVKPELPTYYGAPLKPSNLTRTNYNDYVSQYNVVNAPEPLSTFTVKTYFNNQDGRSRVTLGRSNAIAIPDGYEAYAAIVSQEHIHEIGKNYLFKYMIGGVSRDATSYWGAEYLSFPRNYRGEITFALEVMDCWSFAIGVDIFCNLTNEAFAEWQLKMYDAIMQAYLDQKAAYDAKMEQKNIQKGVEILGRNPIENRRIEKEELKKLIIMILTNNPCLNINSFTRHNVCDSKSPNEPIMDLSKVCPNGSFIRFFENAFEWENILYVFYPYFWGRHAKWINAIHLTDPDLDFAAFLKAGAARVQIPVRPGFEKAIAFYCQTLQLLGTGIIWDGNDVPLIGDDLYVPIIKEISENLGKLDDGVYYPDPDTPNPWEVTIPTSLVVLQDLKEIPNIRDMMTNNNITLINT
ncbi:MAG: hypothetical protein D8M58_03055 [Calditrichaeota bacterium]|nr:MAG: hypothetical protein DWQ03_04025 [Calditrichota bacterium]MBL1204344.1 hypothetical protein [Calditrichota bacterium]NOG44173.1 hypothetical protein [Calditrichota bacterium]